MALPTVKKGKKAAAAPARPAKPAVKAANKKAASKPPSKRPADSSDDSDGSEDEEDDKAAMLAALEAHGRAMFGFGVAAPAESSAQASKRAQESSDEGSDGDDAADFDEDDDEVDEFDDGWGAGDDFVTDSEDEFAPSSKAPAAPAPAPKRVPEVVFAPTGGSSSTLISKAEKRAFLSGNSAKMMGLKAEDEGYVGRGKKRAREADDEDIEDQSNLRLDKTLHDMLLKTLLPTAAADDASRPVEKRNALSGRLLELASYSLPGEGSAQAKAGGMSQHPAAVRTGLLHAQARRAEKARAEAEAAGSWVKGAGGLGDLGKRGAGVRNAGAKPETRTWGKETGKKKGMAGSKNERSKGLSMGFGKYERGALRVSEADIARVNNPKKAAKRKGKGKMSGW